MSAYTLIELIRVYLSKLKNNIVATSGSANAILNWYTVK